MMCLLSCPQFPLSTLSSKRMWMVLCREGINGMGRPRIEMYRSEDNVSGYQPLRVIDLETVRSVQPVGKPYMKSLLLVLCVLLTMSLSLDFRA